MCSSDIVIIVARLTFGAQFLCNLCNIVRFLKSFSDRINIREDFTKSFGNYFVDLCGSCDWQTVRSSVSMS